MQAVQGLHHITAVASNPQANVDFYHNVLGQRLVKTTVNFDDPGTYHLYYGDKVGTPGTIMTFFPWRHVVKGTRGNGETGATAYTIPRGSVTFWQAHLEKQGVSLGEPQTRFGETVLAFQDPDGMILELITDDKSATLDFWEEGPIPVNHALRGFHSVTLWNESQAATGKLLVEQLGYTFVGQEGSRYRYQGASNDIGLYIDILERPGMGNGRFGAGSIHHIAFRTVDDEEQLEYQSKLSQAGYRPTPVMDRQYFHSIYFRSPGGVLFEIATDAPGFPYDEPIEELGTNLKLPSWLEPQRARIEKMLPEFTIKPVQKAEAS